MTVIDLHTIAHQYGSLECDCACGEMSTKEVSITIKEDSQETLEFYTSEIIFNN